MSIHDQIKPAATLENALKWEASCKEDDPIKACDDVCYVALENVGATPSSKMVDALSDALCDIIQSQRHLRALGMGTQPLNSFVVKAEGKHACKRCGGTGFVSQYKHINGGICYGCGGSGRNTKFH